MQKKGPQLKCTRKLVKVFTVRDDSLIIMNFGDSYDLPPGP